MGLLDKRLDVDKLLYKDLSTSKLNSEELRYLKNKKGLKYCVNPNWFPLESIKNSNHIGMSADLIELIKQNLHIPITLVPTKNWTQSIQNIKNGTCDLLPLANDVPNKRKFFNFTETFFTFPVVLATKTNKPYIPSIKRVLRNNAHHHLIYFPSHLNLETNQFLQQSKLKLADLCTFAKYHHAE